ncbi:energy coupling factor transporter S component ThiW [Caldinitratiruptor microaerophilus]|uniref:Energy coupling factor transporter S component ThiW n=1 Tax=Caldinitratiruptor microaerophilus TaxID=671077 RepID=A0AA35G7N5_9FIRM|nr:energy coupling factor transporter S component ThiW [Caldinitratiruptor microaerophilus]
MKTVRPRVHQLTLAALYVAVGVLTSHLVVVPVAFAKAFPVQHFLNVLSAVTLGPGGAVSVAFAVSVLRVALGTGTPLAFPGSMFGALLAGLLYRRSGRVAAALAGEIVGTGVLGALVAVPVAQLVLGRQVGFLVYIVPFTVSSAAGALLAGALLPVLRRVPALQRWLR